MSRSPLKEVISGDEVPTSAMSDRPKSTRGARLPYMPGIDGLRALAVLAVFVYHFHNGGGWLPGGFLGVDVFFVISGYLITSLLLSEFRQEGRVDLVRFWLRRARRLLPAVGVLIAVVMILAVFFGFGQISACGPTRWPRWAT
ncbi:MAG TPA: acyltransferase [Solirubrobacterales bacterium]|nr:acyltransferase [Solirubrobacterales bacterium]